MSYPQRIIPHPNYKIITKDLSDYYLIRHTNSKEFINPLTNKPLIETICSPREQIQDLSTSLLGVFGTDDSKVRIEGENSNYYFEEWRPGESVNTPRVGSDFSIDINRGYFFLTIGEIEGESVDYSKGGIEGFKAFCRVIHTPVKWNYWHFSVRWINEEGDVIEQKGNWKNKFLASARAMIAEFAFYKEPFHEELEVNEYINVNS